MKRFHSLLLACLAVAATAGLLWYQNRTIIPKESTWEDVLAEARQGGYRLIGTGELWERYRPDAKSILLVDTRQDWEYRTGHIQGALNFPMEPTWMARWSQKDELERFLGPDKDRFLVFY
jgi:hypothetical protein